MADITIYTTPNCPYCMRAKALLKQKGHENYKEIDVAKDDAAREEMTQKTGRRTVPQVFINGTHVGGFDDMSALDKAGKLDPLLQGQA